MKHYPTYDNIQDISGNLDVCIIHANDDIKNYGRATYRFDKKDEHLAYAMKWLYTYCGFTDVELVVEDNIISVHIEN